MDFAERFRLGQQRTIDVMDKDIDENERGITSTEGARTASEGVEESTMASDIFLTDPALVARRLEYVESYRYNVNELSEDCMNSIRTLRAVKRFVSTRISIERRYAKEMSTLEEKTRQSLEVATGTLGDAWGAILNNTTSAAEQHGEFADALEEEVKTPLELIANSKALKTLTRSISSCKSCAATFEKKLKHYQRLREKAIREIGTASAEMVREDIEDESSPTETDVHETQTNSSHDDSVKYLSDEKEKSSSSSTSAKRSSFGLSSPSINFRHSLHGLGDGIGGLLKGISSSMSDRNETDANISKTSVAMACIEAWREVEDARDEYLKAIEYASTNAFRARTVHAVRCKDGMAKYAIFLSAMVAHMTFDVRNIAKHVDQIDVVNDIENEADRFPPSALRTMGQALKSPPKDVETLATTPKPLSLTPKEPIDNRGAENHRIGHDDNRDMMRRNKDKRHSLTSSPLGDLYSSMMKGAISSMRTVRLQAGMSSAEECSSSEGNIIHSRNKAESTRENENCGGSKPRGQRPEDTAYEVSNPIRQL